MRRLLLYALIINLIGTIRICQAQTTTPSLNTNIIPPSPNAATFQRYGDYPVDLSTGLPDISIPIYQIKEGRLGFPITLSYHASGRNMSMNLSPLGIGWALNAGGIISRTVKGRADALPFQAPPYNFNTDSSTNQGTLNSDLVAMAPNNPNESPTNPDSQHDIFTFNVNGKTGKFIIDSGHVIMLAGEPYQVQVISGNYLKITDEQGIQYLFGTQPGDTGGGVESSVDQNGLAFYSSWMLNTLTTTTGQLIKFKYDSVSSTSFGTSPIMGNISVSDQYSINDNMDGTGPTTPPNLNNIGSTTNVLSSQDFHMYYIREIDFDNGSMHFNYDDSLKLLNCELQDYTGKLIKSDTLFYHDLPNENLPNNNSVLLDSLFVRDNIGNSVQKYSFEYNVGNIPPGVGLGWNMVKQTDWWGYFNENTGISVPHFNVDIDNSGALSYQSIGNSDAKDPSYDAKIYTTLKKITYPTGGTTQFILEPNKYLDNSGILRIGPGLRVQQIISSDGLGNSLTKLYKYGSNESGYGTLLFYPDTTHFMFQNLDFNYYVGSFDGPEASINIWRSRTFGSILNPMFSEEYSYPVYYPQVSEYQTSSNNSITNGKTINYYQLPQTTTYAVKVPTSFSGITFDYIAANPRIFLSSSEAMLLKKQIYSFNNNNYNLVSEDDYTYGQYNTSNTNDEYMSVFTNLWAYSPGNSSIPTVDLQLLDSAYPVFMYALGGSISSVSQRVNAHQHIEYTTTGLSISTTTNYQYLNPNYPFPTSIQTNNSKGELITSTMKYPLDYQNITASDGTSTGINNLINLHVIAPVIERSTYRSNADGSNNRLASSTFTTYTSPMPLPDSISSIDTTSPISNFVPSTVSGGSVVKDYRYTPRVSFNLYDNYGNILEQQKASDIKESYIWGYNFQYPVAKILGSGYAAASGLVNLSILNNAATYTNAQMRTQLNNLRTGLPQALVNTYTYTPLIGVTSATDPKGYTTYYDYDSFGRLAEIRDNDSNLIKSFSYVYNNSNNLPDVVTYSNVEEVGQFTRNNCSTGYTGSTITYTVPVSKYISSISQADANQQAQNDVNLYGQNYANEYGACAIPVITTTVELSYNISSVISRTPVTVVFQQSGTTTQTGSFPVGSGPYNSITLPVGTYALQFTLPSTYSGHSITFTLSPGGTTWSSTNGTTGSNGNILLNAGSVTFNQGTTYSITMTGQ